MAETIAEIILGGSLFGIGAIIARKIPLLVEVPEEEIEDFSFKTPFLIIIRKAKKSKIFAFDLILQKLLSKVRVIALRFDKRTEEQLRKLRERSKRRQEIEGDDYWQELRKTKKK